MRYYTVIRIRRDLYRAERVCALESGQSLLTRGLSDSRAPCLENPIAFTEGLIGASSLRVPRAGTVVAGPETWP